ncbi:MAG: DNA polymerase III subunit gamma/tau [Bryobacteraceae bacterium]|nr:DNA polymerase III subunit gamma/tau [Bryobacteraceae bacterium]MCX7604556.1 DNA polymerase III subunit gamma/tau [Bryobacteraceae bacterium]
MYQVLARKYRPQTFAELLGQEHVRATIENAIAQRRIAHGYIFAGQRGTGKTTVARILARCLNCVGGPTPSPCGQCSSCVEIAQGNAPDVIEIDAASNRGINEMRELRENVRYRPSRDRYKIFIIDEAHQITNEAFNALLKTLEEPPEWAVFVLCTTEAHKIPATIASRCQQFSFRSVDFGLLTARLREICRAEGIEADEEALAVLAQAGEGSVRDSLSALDQAIACCGSRLEGPAVRQLLGLYGLETLEKAAAALDGGSAAQMLEIVAELENSGRNLQYFCRELCRYFRNLLVAKIAGADTRLIAASPAEQARLRETAARFREEDLTRWLQLSLDIYSQLQYSLQPRLHLELGLLRLLHAGRLKPIEDVLAALEPGGGATAPAAGGGAGRTAAGPAPRSAAPAAPAAAPEGSLRQRLIAALEAMGASMSAHAVEESELRESQNTVEFLAPRSARLALQSPDVQKALEQVLGRRVRVVVTFTESGNGSETRAEKAPAAGGTMDAAAARALEHPAVKKFQELFPHSQVRDVRNLRED